MSRCPVCQKMAYPVESIKIEGVVMHKTCFKCSVCKRTLNGSNFAKNHGIYYCKVHFQQMFREKGNYDEGFGQKKHSADWGKKEEPKKEEPVKKVEPVKKEEPKPVEQPKKEEPKKVEEPVKKEEPKPVEQPKEEPKKEEPPKEEPKPVEEPPKPVEWKMAEETQKLLKDIMGGLDKLEGAVTKLEANGVTTAAPVKNEQIDNVFARLDAVLAKLEQK